MSESITVEQIENGYLVKYFTGFGSSSIRSTRKLTEALAWVAEFYGDLKVGEHVIEPTLTILTSADLCREYKERRR